MVSTGSSLTSLFSVCSVIKYIHRFTVNDVTYLPQKVPSLYTALSVGNYSTNPLVYGEHTNPFVLKYNEVVEVIINNNHYNLHPWHIHGHQYQVLARNGPQEGIFNGSYGNYSATPMRRDTIMLNKGPSHTILRFRADNPDKFSLPKIRCYQLTLYYAFGLSTVTSNGTLLLALWLPLSKRPITLIIPFPETT